MSGWVDVCPEQDIVPDTGVCALVAGRAVAVFRLRDGAVHALDNVDPFTGASVLSRGILGDRDGVPTVASPLHKHEFDLRSGQCVGHESVQVRAHAVRVRDGVVQIAVTPPA